MLWAWYYSCADVRVTGSFRFAPGNFRAVSWFKMAVWICITLLQLQKLTCSLDIWLVKTYSCSYTCLHRILGNVVFWLSIKVFPRCIYEFCYHKGQLFSGNWRSLPALPWWLWTRDWQATESANWLLSSISFVLNAICVEVIVKLHATSKII